MLTVYIHTTQHTAIRGGGTLLVVYFILITVIGNFMLFNLFVAIIITGFSENKADILKEEKENQVMLEADKMRSGMSNMHDIVGLFWRIIRLFWRISGLYWLLTRCILWGFLDEAQVCWC